MKNVFKRAFAVAIIVVMTAFTVMPAFAAAAAPDFSSGDYVDLLPYMKEEKYGKQKDDEDGVRMSLTKNNSGYTAKFKSQAINYGVRFNHDIFNQDGAMYISCELDAKNDLWDGPNAPIYGGPVIQLGYGNVEWGDFYSGYFTLFFTEQDGIDFRMSDKIGNDLAYIGAATAGLKVNYPDTKSKNRGKNGYKVIIKFTKTDITVWLNGVTVIDGIKFDKLYSSTGSKIPCTVERLEAGMHTNASRTTIHNFRLYCLKADAAGAASAAAKQQNTEVTNKSGNGNSSKTAPNNGSAAENKTNVTTNNTSSNRASYSSNNSSISENKSNKASNNTSSNRGSYSSNNISDNKKSNNTAATDSVNNGSSQNKASNDVASNTAADSGNDNLADENGTDTDSDDAMTDDTDIDDGLYDEYDYDGNVETNDNGVTDASVGENQVLIRGEKIEFFNWQTPVIIIALAILAIGAIASSVYLIIAGRKK